MIAEQILIAAFTPVTDNTPVVVTNEADIDALLANTPVENGQSIAFIILDSDGGDRSRAIQGQLTTTDTYGCMWLVRVDSPLAADIADALREKIHAFYPNFVHYLNIAAVNGYTADMQNDRVLRKGGTNFCGIFMRVTYSYDRLIRGLNP